jgi:hypothetical protein
MKTSYQAKYSPTLLCGISMWTASPMTTYSTPGNPRLETRLSTWMLKPSAYICIQGTRITGQYEDAIREHIDGSYLRHYLSDKHKWTDLTWSWIDWYSHERHLKVLKAACLYQRLKFIHEWQPTNSQKLKFTKSDDAV